MSTTTAQEAQHANNADHANTPARSARHWLSDMLQLAAGQRRLMTLTIAATVLAQTGMVTSLATGAWLAGMAIGGATLPQLAPGFWLLVAAVLAGAGGRWWQAHVSHAFAFALIETLQMGIYDGMERAAPGYVLGRRTGELAAIATGDAEMMEHFFAHMLGDAIAATVVPVLALAALAFLHPLLTLALLPFLPLLATVPFWLGSRAQAQGRKMAEATGRLNADVAEGIQGRRELALFGRERDWLDKIASGIAAVNAEQRRYGARAGMEQAAIELLQAGAVLAAALAGGVLMTAGALPASAVPLAVVLVGAALVPLAEVAQTARKLGELRAGTARIVAIQRQPALVEDRGRRTPKGASLHFEQVEFGYGGGRDGVLRGVAFNVNAAETVALVGRSGMGKSTCASLLLRFWDVHGGRVRIGDADIRDLPLATLRNLVAVVPQDVYLFDDSIENNIRLGRPAASRQAVEHAARLAQAHDFIAALPRGYDTRCGERGARLSGGQRQRIAIARALLRDAPILVLDEAASSIDAESEQALHAALAGLRRDRTVLMIAHRPSTIRQADRIVVLENGRIAEQGSHAELMARHGAYARLVAQADAAC